jgi:putative phosphoesterase
MRIGVLADTHVGEHLASLPPEIGEIFAGVDLILHAGDLSDTVVLDELGRVAPVAAVRGNHDEEGGIDALPRDLVVRVGGVSIGLTHGHRTQAVELPAAALSLVAGRACLLGFDRTVRHRFGAVDCVVTGHLHLPIQRRVGRVLLFSPGAVFVPEADPHYDWTGLAARGYRRFRRGLPPEAHRPAVGIIELAGGEIRTRRIPLERPIFPGDP